MKVLSFGLAALLLIAGGANAQSAGSGTLNGADRIKARGCGKETSALSVAFTLDGGGAWTATADGDVFSGTSTTSGRTTSLTLDGASQSLLGAVVEDLASDLCEDTVTVNSLGVTKARLKLNKRRTSAKLEFKAIGTGSSSAGTSTGSYRIKAKGAWTLAP